MTCKTASELSDELPYGAAVNNHFGRRLGRRISETVFHIPARLQARQHAVKNRRVLEDDDLFGIPLHFLSGVEGGLYRGRKARDDDEPVHSSIGTWSEAGLTVDSILPTNE